jgi:purine-binding chemotaxis protein CheW
MPIRKGDETVARQTTSILNEQEDTLVNKYLIFTIDKEEYGIEITHILEIIGIQPITPVPDVESYVRGVTNLRGKIVPVIDARLKLKKDFRQYDDRTCIIIINYKDILMGMIIDKVSEVINLVQEDILPPSSIKKGANSRYIKSIGKYKDKIAFILDCEEIVKTEELEEAGN